MTRLTVHMPLRLPSVANLREHWAAKAKRVRAHREAVALCWPRLAKLEPWRWPLTVRIVRVAPRKLDDDNLCSAGKAIRDQVAKELHVNDGGDQVVWEYAQERGPYAVRIEIREAQ